MKTPVFLGVATSLLASLAVCIVSGRLLPGAPSLKGVPAAVPPVLGLSVPARSPAASADQKSRAIAVPLPRGPEEQSRQLQLEIGRALVSVDDAQRERAYTQLLPELIRIDPPAMKRLVENCPGGPVREQLLRHAARTWSSGDLDGAIEWVTAMTDEGERVIAATEIVSQVGQADPGRAIEVSDLLGVGRNDGTVEHIAQLWATENLSASLQWVEAQPPGVRRDQLLARIAIVQAETAPADAVSTALREISPGQMQDDAIASAVGRWLAHDADAASAWVEGLPQGRIRDLAKAEVATSPLAGGS